MTCYSLQARDNIFVKGYGVLPFANNMGRNVGENRSKILKSKNSQKHIDHAKQYLQQMHLKLTQKEKFKKLQKKLVI